MQNELEVWEILYKVLKRKGPEFTSTYNSFINIEPVCHYDVYMIQEC